MDDDAKGTQGADEYAAHKPRFVADDEVPKSLGLDEPDEASSKGQGANKSTGFKGFLRRYWQHKLWTLPLTILGVLLVSGGAVMALPTTRYIILGNFIQCPFKIIVTDSITGAPVSAASITLDGQQAETNSGGVVTLTVPVGNSTVHVTKTYYKSATQTVLVDLSTQSDSVKIPLVATGRPVPVKVVNKITGKPIPEAVITAGDATAKTDLNGEATIVVPAGAATQDATVTVDGYNALSTKLDVTTQVIDANTFALVPTGRMYFLSNLSGKIDVVSTDLDGGNRQTVLAGTGNEDPNNTVLLASRDWKYLALLSKRDGGNQSKLFLITTSTNAVTTIDSSATDFTLIGWSDHYFVYQAAHSNLSAWQPGGTTIVSYNADTSKPATLISTSATGTSDADAQYENIFQTALMGGTLVYAKTWYTYPGYITGVTGQQNTLASIKPDGTGGKTLKTVDASQYYFSSLSLANPDTLYFAVFDNTNSNPNYYRLDTSGNISQSSIITSDSVSQTYPTYLASPSGKSTFWSETRDGKQTLFVGDADGNNANQIATLSDYTPYGWFSDDYVLVEKNGSELYIMPAAGGIALKLSDYYKPDYTFYGYGGGYGGL